MRSEAGSSEAQGTNARTQPLVCIECDSAWTSPSERWRVYVTDDAKAELVPYCSTCAGREFDGP
jgi:hypothetical protein